MECLTVLVAEWETALVDEMKTAQAEGLDVTCSEQLKVIVLLNNHKVITF